MPKRARGMDGASGDPVPKLVVGTDFSGLDGVIWMLHKLGVPYLHAFSSDSDRNVRKFLAHHHMPMEIYEDVRDRAAKDTPPVDLYVLGPPCVGHSKAGSRMKSGDDRGALWLCGLVYIQKHKPSMIIFENVPDFEKDEIAWGTIMRTLEPHYKVSHKVMSTHKLGVPQQRNRLYLIAIKRSRQSRKFIFPEDIGEHKPLESFLGRCRRVALFPKPADKPTSKPQVVEKMQAAVVAAYEKVVSQGVNPCTSPVCIDLGNSDKFGKTITVGRVNTLTKSHCERFEYFVSTYGFLNLSDFIRLSGYDPNMMDFVKAGVAPRAAAAMLGNCMSGNMLLLLLPAVLHAGGIINDTELVRMSKQAREDLHA